MPSDAVPRPATDEHSPLVRQHAATEFTQAFSRRPIVWLTDGVRFAWLLFVALVVQWPYRTAYHVSDDRYLQFLIGLLQTARIGWSNYLFKPLEGHFVPVWKLVYYMQWRCYGLDVPFWHFSITVVHVGTAWLLYWLLAKYLKSSPVALFGATLWAAAAVGRWDNPMAWLATGQIPWSLLWLLSAMVCQTRAMETGRRRWMCGMVTCLSAAVLTWGASLALSVVLPLQVVLLEQDANRAGRSRRAMMTVWAITFSLLAMVIMFVLLPHMTSSTTQRSVPEVTETVSRVISQLSVAFAALSGWDYTTDAMQGLSGKQIVAGIAILLVVLIPRAKRRVLAVFLGLALVHVTLIDVFRADISFRAAVSWGRYLYLATLAWSVAAAVALDAVLRLARGRMAWAILLLVALLVPLHMAHQRAIAIDTMNDFTTFFHGEHEKFTEQTELVFWLDSEARSQGARLAVPDIPLNIEPTEGVYFPLSAFLAIVAPSGLSNLDIVRGSEVPGADFRSVIQALERSDSPMAPQWVERVDSMVDLMTHLTWLSQCATDTDTIFRIPDRTVRIPPLNFPMAQAVGMNFPAGLPGCRVVSVDEADPPEFDRELEQLAEQTGEEARWWEAAFREKRSIVVERR